MDETLKVFTEYFRDIYAASGSSCAGVCDAETRPALMGPEGFEIRKCCKSACSDKSITTLEFCEDYFCEEKCASIRETDFVSKCMQTCKVACRNRFS